VSVKAKLVVFASLGLIVLGVAALPLILLGLPDPHPVAVPGLEGERVGTYVLRDDGVYKLFPYTAPLFSFPGDALLVDDPQPRVVVKYRQLDSLSLYGISRYGTGQTVDVEKTLIADGSLRVQPTAPLPAGEYVITAARDGMFGGEDYFYFRVP
jgi:hypothetical protein